MHLNWDVSLLVLGLLVLAAAVLSGIVASLAVLNRELRRSAVWWESAAGALVPFAETLAGLRLHHPVTYPDGSYTVVCDDPIDDVIEMHVTAAGERRLIRHPRPDPWSAVPDGRIGSR